MAGNDFQPVRNGEEPPVSVRHVATLAVGCVLAACAVTGCESQIEDPPPSPTPTYECTAPGSCTPQQAAKEQQAAKDHAAAEEALRDGLAEIYRLLRAGGANQGTPELKRTVAGKDLSSAVKALKRFKKQGRVGHGEVTVTTVRFMTPYPEDTQRVYVCEDGSGFYTTDKHGENPTKHGVKQAYTAILNRIDNQWKRVDTENLTEVSSCTNG